MKTGKKLLTGSLLALCAALLVLLHRACRRMEQGGKNRHCTAGGAEQRHGDPVEIQR